MSTDQQFQELTKELRKFLKQDSFEELAEEIAMGLVHSPLQNSTETEEEECREQLWIARHRVITKALLAVALERVQ